MRILSATEKKIPEPCDYGEAMASFSSESLGKKNQQRLCRYLSGICKRDLGMEEGELPGSAILFTDRIYTG